MPSLPATILLAALVVPIAATVQAGDNVVMVELYTSQGCSSCPPADETLNRLAERSDVLALSLHVDYWDYLGWRDTFAQAEHAERQAEYRDKLGGRVLFTPQMIVDGRRSVPGFRRGLLETAIREAGLSDRSARIDIHREGGILQARVACRTGHPPSTIWVASYDQAATVEIDRGENAGHTFTYRNVVDKLMKVGPMQGSGPETFALPQPGPGEGVAVWLQDDRTGHILAASYAED